MHVYKYPLPAVDRLYTWREVLTNLKIDQMVCLIVVERIENICGSAAHGRGHSRRNTATTEPTLASFVCPVQRTESMPAANDAVKLHCCAHMHAPVSAEVYRRSGLVISREQGLRYDAGCAVQVLMS